MEIIYFLNCKFTCDKPNRALNHPHPAAYPRSPPPRNQRPWTCPDQELRTEVAHRSMWPRKQCAVRGPLVPSRWGGPQYNGGCQTNSAGQQCTAWHHFLPLTRGPNPAGPPAFFRWCTAAILNPFLQVSTYRHSRPAQPDSTDVLICPSGSRWLSDWKTASSLKSRHF